MAGRVQRLCTRQRGALAQFVGGHHMHAALQPFDMPIGNDIAGSRIHQHIAGTQRGGFCPRLQDRLPAWRRIGVLQGLLGADATILRNT